MRSGYVPILVAVLCVACGGAPADIPDNDLEEGGSLLTTEIERVPVSLQLCDDPSEDSLADAMAAGFVPQLDADGAYVAIGAVISGSVAAEEFEALEAAGCVLTLERADQRIIETPGAP